MMTIKISVFVLFVVVSVSCSQPWYVSRFEGDDRLNPNDTVNSQWMGVLSQELKGKKVSDITLIGVHDSAAYELTDNISPGAVGNPMLEEFLRIALKFALPVDKIIKDWALAQGVSVYDQLALGARHIDLRATWDEKRGNWYTDHFLEGNLIQTILDQIESFMVQHPTEVLVLEVSHFSNSNRTVVESLIDMLRKTFGSLLAPRRATNDFTIPTIDEMVAKNQRILCLFAFDYDGLVDFWPSHRVFDGIYTNEDRVDDMIASNKRMMLQNGGGGRIYELFWTLTTRARDVEDGLLEFDKPHTLKDLARIANWQLKSNFQDKIKNRLFGNTLFIDHIQQSFAVELSKMWIKRQCFDDAQYIARSQNGSDCRSWESQGKCSDSEIQKKCPLTCGLCPQLPLAGDPGHSCQSKNDCQSGHCAKGMCLVDNPVGSGDDCGDDSQCVSVSCSTKHNQCD